MLKLIILLSDARPIQEDHDGSAEDATDGLPVEQIEPKGAQTD